MPNEAQRLHADTGLPAVFAIPAYGATVCLAHCVGGEVAEAPPGVIEPAYESAAGKVLLASREPWRTHVLRRLEAVDVEEVDRELEAVRNDGYAIAASRSTLQIAAPVGFPELPALAAIGVIGPLDSAVEPLRKAVCEAAACASAALVGAGPDAPVHGAIASRPLLVHGLTAVNSHL